MQGYLFLQLPFKTAVKFLGSSKAREKNKNTDCENILAVDHWDELKSILSNIIERNQEYATQT